jgi:hypothetical protein
VRSRLVDTGRAGRSVVGGNFSAASGQRADGYRAEGDEVPWLVRLARIPITARPEVTGGRHPCACLDFDGTVRVAFPQRCGVFLEMLGGDEQRRLEGCGACFDGLPDGLCHPLAALGVARAEVESMARSTEGRAVLFAVVGKQMVSLRYEINQLFELVRQAKVPHWSS